MALFLQVNRLSEFVVRVFRVTHSQVTPKLDFKSITTILGVAEAGYLSEHAEVEL